MANGPMNTVIQHLRQTIRLQDQEGWTDGHLLAHFIEHRDDATFATILRRHGPMVMGVCRRLLHNHHDAEDAFQATFLVLVRKFAAIGQRELLANWLYGVAYHTALKAKAATMKLRAREKQVTEMPEPPVQPQRGSNELQALLDQELSRLPPKYRTPIVLCDLEGKTRKEAARLIGCPEGSLSSRLSRARAMLAKRLSRHGLAVSGASLAAVMSPKAALACVAPAVVASTCKSATLVAAGHAAAAVISPSVAAFTEGVLRAMLLAKLRNSILGLVVGVLAIVVAGSAFQTGATERWDGDKQKAGKGVHFVLERKKRLPDPPKKAATKVDKEKLPGGLARPLPPALEAAWQKANANVGWLRPHASDYLQFVPGKEGKAGDVPAFRFSSLPKGVLTKLPAPAAPFGLYLVGTNVTDGALRELAGFKSLQSLNLGLTRVTDAGLKELAGLRGLHALDLAGARVTDAGLKKLAMLKRLQWLSLRGTQATDAGLKGLAGLKSLQTLNLGLTRVTDAGLKKLAGLRGLHALDLYATRVTDAGLKELAGFKSLRGLSLRETRVTDAGLKELATLKKLQWLSLRGTQTMDAGLKELVGFQSLRRLSLRDTRVTDAGLKELAGFKTLRSLNLATNAVTEAGLRRLQKALPACVILH